MQLIDTNNLFFTIVLLIPGFISLSFGNQLGGKTKEYNSQIFFTWSFFISIINDFFIWNIFQLLQIQIPENNQLLLNSFFDFFQFFIYSTIILLTGFLIGFYHRYNLSNKITEKFWNGTKDTNTVWDTVLIQHDKQWINVELKNNTSYSGILSNFSLEDQKREIYVLKPQIIPENITIGEGMWINLEEIRFIVFTQPQKDLEVENVSKNEENK